MLSVVNTTQADEMIQTPFKPAAEPGSLAVAIRNGSFAWQKDGDSLLRDIDLQVQAGQLIIVIGEVNLYSSSIDGSS